MKRTPHTLLTSLAALALVGTAFAGTATADGKDDAPGQAVRSETPASAEHGKSAEHGGKVTANAVTEDDDTNDGGTRNNVVDAGDNRHPSGKDRSVEHGGSGNQGRSTSDPDDDGRGPDRSNGGADKPDGPGGVDAADQDANNGCGNDDDFEDDNEGWCGRKPAKPAKEAPKPAARSAAAEKACPAGTVDMNGSKAGGCEAPATSGAADTSTPPPAGEVLSSAATNPELSLPCPLAALVGAVPMPAGCDSPLLPAVLSGSVQAASVGAAFPAEGPGETVAGAPAVATVSARQAGPAAVLSAASGALAATGANVSTLLVAALLAIAAGVVLLGVDRRRSA